MAYYRAQEHETLQKQKLYVCSDCGFKIRIEGRSHAKECLCAASRACRNLCNGHRDNIENAATAPLAIAEEYLINRGILKTSDDLCINCGIQEANMFSAVWACKLCREWVQDTPESVDFQRS